MKKISMPFAFVAILIGCLFLYMQGCKKNSDDATPETIKIGCSFPLTLQGAEASSQSRINAVLLAAEEINKSLLFDKKIEIVAQDNEFNIDKAIAVANDLISKGCKTIVGCSSSSRTLATAKQATISKGVLLISPSATSPELTTLADNNLVWRTAPSDIFQIDADYGFTTLGKRKAGIIYVNDSYGVGLSSVFKARFVQLGGTVANYISYPALTDYSSYDFSAKVDSLFDGNPDLIYIIAMGSDGSKIANTIGTRIDLSYNPQLMGCASLFNSDFLPPNSPASVVEGMIGSISTIPNNDNYKNYALNYKAKFGIDPLPYSENAYDALYLVVYAMLKANSEIPTEIVKQMINVSKEGDVINVNQFEAAKAKILAGTDIDYNGASGNLDLDTNGDITTGYFKVWKIVNGQFTDVAVISFP